MVKNITVGDGPNFIDTYGDFVYVANSGNDTVSVIDSNKNNTVVKNITVGDHPYFLYSDGDAIYVANYDSNTISVIDPSTNEVVAGVSFDTIPFRGGHIICNGMNAPISRYFYVSSGTECVAKPKSGFEFDSWVEIFDDNSTRTIKVSTTSDWLIDPVAAFRDAFSGDPAANLNVTKFGNFTA